MPLRRLKRQLACQREAVIRPLAEADRLSCLQVDRAAKILGLGRSVTYRLIEIPLIKGNFRAASANSTNKGDRDTDLHRRRASPKRITRMGFTMMAEGIGGINVSLIATSGTLFLKARLDADKAQRSR
jgi:hypothetical protein